MANFTGMMGDDNLIGTTHDDNFDMTQGGVDKVAAGKGNDTIDMGATLTAADQINGGVDNDSVMLNGDYNLVMAPKTLVNVENIQLASGHNYSINVNDGNVAAGAYLQFFASLTAGETLTIDGHRELDGRIIANTGGEDDTFIGSAGNDYIQTSTGNDTFLGGDGGDLFGFNGGMWLTAADRIDGGAGTDQVAIGGDYSAGLTFASLTMRNVEDLSLSHGDFKLTMNNGNVAAGATMQVDGFLSDHLIFDGSAETNGSYLIWASKTGRADLTGGQIGDTFAVANSSLSGAARNTIHRFDFDMDKVKFANVTDIDARVSHGSVSNATFDTDLTNIFGAGMTHELGAHHTVAFQADAGGLMGQWFLIVDGDGTAGYLSGHDLVLQLDAPLHVKDIDTTDFMG